MSGDRKDKVGWSGDRKYKFGGSGDMKVVVDRWNGDRKIEMFSGEMATGKEVETCESSKRWTVLKGVR